MRVAVYSMLLVGAGLISASTRAADLPVPTRPVVQRELPLSPEAQRKQLFEEFLQFLRDRAPR
jgi:hypothetical protein